jgi:prepilin-type N-terminal cleavage/methylation domain-containing protein/prepilin-type processing-associated H-X9-DG protein
MITPKTPHRPFRRAAGFTLIELLTVIAIIGILSSILITSVSAARSAGDLARSLSNLRQYYNVNLMHANDNRGLLLPIIARNGSNLAIQWFSDPVFKSYLGLAPNAPIPPQLISPRATITDAQGNLRLDRSYGMNITDLARQFGSFNNANQRYQFRLDQVRDPSRTIMMADAGDWILQYNALNNWRGIEEHTLSGAAFRYSDKAGFLFYDGHVAGLNREQARAIPEQWNVVVRR